MKRKALMSLFLPFVVYVGYCQEVSLQELFSAKQYRAVIEQAVQNQQPDTLDFETLYLYGQAFEGVFKYKDALTWYELSYQKDSTHTDLLNTMARTAMNLGRSQNAENYFKKALVNDTTHFYTNFQLARLYQQTGEIIKAIDIYEYLLERDVTNVTLLRNLGDCWLKLNDPVSTYFYYNEAWSNNPENVGLASLLINLILSMGDPFSMIALEICEKALSYNPENITLLQNKAMALYVNKEYAQADSLYSELILDGDSSYRTLKYGGAARYNAGHYFTSVELLELAYEEDTTSIDVCLLLGSAIGKTYDRKKGFEFLQIAENNMKPNPTHLYQLNLYRAEIHKKSENYDEAARLYYALWKENNQRLKCLHEIATSQPYTKWTPEADEKDRQKTLFIHVLFVNEYLKAEQNPAGLWYNRHILNGFYEDMFFRDVRELPALAPDGKKTVVTAQEIKDLLDRIPQRSSG